ncbi:aminotransferase class I/II-fold pyridoxal phosphate-dependent enzyme [Galbibacter mesophilus]|uniref:aminotransferase class I/II-fold pyridoxal phosphate-dependent enzyme n=1 Tax=Galbibacter mesophilus TaxID=379069 RepID=UPI00191F6D29|nr:aminotransferase class I/II-fold pyridoxal phosphate-dependent enzyme [Galbibacter mesophilus]MCM5662789.1 aminotransferase class I/II-fold pyridoxal phosphate-dependent enzyme [Galbibacter mesophilus]
MITKVDEFPDRKITTELGDFLYFGGTAYLGLQTLSDFQQIFIENIQKYGTNYGASRKSNIQFSIFEEVESYLAKKIGSESCCTLSSGYLASQLVSHYFSSEEYQKLIVPHTHSSLFTKNETACIDYHHFLKVFQQSEKDKKKVIFFDSVDFTENTYPSYPFLKNLDLTETILVVDDSHGFGVLGKTGEGVYKLLKQFNAKEIVVCGSLGKGFGVQAGAIFGTQTRIASIQKTDTYGGASPALPAAVSTLKDASSIYEERLKKLRENQDLFYNNLKKKELFVQLSDHPTFTFFNERLTEHLLANNILITSFRYPTENDELMSRIVLSAHHTKEDIEKLVTALNCFTG